MFKTALVFIVLIIVLYLASYFGVDAWVHPKKWYILAFFGMVSYLYHTLINIGIRDNREKFIELYLTSFTIRFVLSLLFIGTMILVQVENPNLFVLNFFALYLFFTIFEITNLLRKLRRFSDKE